MVEHEFHACQAGRIDRVAVIGPPGSGKSRFARALAARTGIPVVHLDPIFWAPGWQRAPRAEAERRLADAVAGERWIIDGNFLGAVPERFARADAVVLLDRSPWLCFRRVAVRTARKPPRADLPEGCTDALDREMLRDLLTYRRRERPRALELATHVLRTDADVARFLG